MDAFFASVEQLDHPWLRSRPILVGSDQPRGVVAAASYEARRFGCHSALPMAIAKRRCPQATVVPVRAQRYRGVSKHVFKIFDVFTPLVQPLSIDEAFLDVTGSKHLHGCGATIAAKIRQKILSQLGLTASVGVAPNQFVAKIASDMHKPDSVTIIQNDEIEKTLAPLLIDRMWGVGPAMHNQLQQMGIKTFGDMQQQSAALLEARFGTHGRRMHHLAHGRDARQVVPDRKAKSISQEHTFVYDVKNPDIVRQFLLEQIEQVAHRLYQHSCRARTVTLKIRFGDFKTITRSSTLWEADNRVDRLWGKARNLFDRWANTSFEPIRLIGFAAGGLTTSGSQLSLFTQKQDERSTALDQATHAICTKFGSQAIRRGLPPR